MTKQRVNPLRSLATGVGMLMISSVAIQAFDTSSIVEVSGGYHVRDVLTSQPVSGGYTVANGQVHVWMNDMFAAGNIGYMIGDIATGHYSTIGMPPGNVVSNGFGDPFGVYDAANGYFYAGTYNASGSGIYRYSVATSTWSALGVFNSLYGADIHDGKVYASGLNAIWNGSAGQGNQIALYDLTGGSSHDVLIQATGNSANVAVDSFGNVYYANYGQNAALYRWSFDDINLVRADLGHGAAGGGAGDLFLTYDDAEVLTFLPDGGNGLAVDEGGNVFLTVNGATSSLLMWNAAMGTWSEEDPFHFQSIAGLDAGMPFGWFGSMDTEGDFLNGGSVYLSNYGSNGLAEVTMAVPEPSSIALLVLGVGGFILRRKWKQGAHVS